MEWPLCEQFLALTGGCSGTASDSGSEDFGLRVAQKCWVKSWLTVYVYYTPPEGPSIPETSEAKVMVTQVPRRSMPCTLHAGRSGQGLLVFPACRQEGSENWCVCPSVLPLQANTGFMGHMAGSPQLLCWQKPEKRLFSRGMAWTGRMRDGEPFMDYSHTPPGLPVL